MQTIVAQLSLLAQESPEKQLLDAPEGVFTYGQFYQRALSIADQIHRAGVPRGARVGIIARDHGSSFSALFGCWLAGNVAVPINLGLSSAQQEQILKQAEVSLVLMQGGEGTISLNVPILRYIEIAYPQPPRSACPLEGGDLALILFTSGSTGVSKGACLTLDSLGANAELTGAVLGLGDGDRIFVNTPPYYTSTVSHFLTLLSVHGSLVARNGFYFGKAMVEQMERCGCSGFGGAPTHLIRLVETTDADKLPRSIQFWMSSGDHLPVAIQKKALDKFPHLRVYSAYGLTEVGGRLCVLPPAALSTKMGSVGRPLPGMQVIIRNGRGGQSPPYELGEVYVSGPLLMQKYLSQDNAPAEFATGDYGYLDGDGYLWLKGRRDDIFKSGAEKVSTVQVQEAILATEMCLDIAVVAVEDAFLGKVPHAYVVPNSRFHHDSFMQQIRAVLSPPMVPKRVHVVTAIPRTGSGKLRRTGLRDETQAEFS